MIYGYGALIVRYLRRLPHLREMLPREEERPPSRHAITHRWDFYGAFYFPSILLPFYLVRLLFAAHLRPV